MKTIQRSKRRDFVLAGLVGDYLLGEEIHWGTLTGGGMTLAGVYLARQKVSI